jgi:hypothetical protein
MIKLKELIHHSNDVGKAIEEWLSSNRRMECVSATNWFLNRVNGFHQERLPRYTKNGEYFEHVVAESDDGRIRIDLSPYADKPRQEES